VPCRRGATSARPPPPPRAAASPPNSRPPPSPQVGQDALEATGGTLGTLELAGHTDTVVSLAFNASGTLLASGSLDATVRVWSAADGACVRTLEGPADDVHWVTWHPRGDVVLAGSEDFSVWMWLARSGDCMQVFSGHHGPVTAGAFTADGKAVVTAGGDGDASLRVWNPKTGECTLTVSGHPFHEEGVTCLALHGAGDSGAALTGAADGSVRITNLHNGRVLASPSGAAGARGEGGAGRRVRPRAATPGPLLCVLCACLLSDAMRCRGCEEQPTCTIKF
jgi:WD40 repeat protein